MSQHRRNFGMTIGRSLLGLLCGSPLVFGQSSTSNQAVTATEAVKPAVPEINPKFRSPRATVRSFLIAMNLTEDNPSKIEDAAACLDLSGLPPDRRDGNRMAFELEFILRSTNIPTRVIPDLVEGSEYEFGENKDVKIRLQRMADGRWLFSSKTVQELAQMRLALWQQGLAANQGKEITDVPTEFRSPYAMFRTFTTAIRKGDLHTASLCLDLSEIPDPAQQAIGKGLAFKLKEILDRSVFVIFQDLHDTSVNVPLEALVNKEGRIVAERQFSGERKGQWLFNRATIRSLDHLYEVFESKPLVPELISIGRSAQPPSFRLAPDLWLRERIPVNLRQRVRLDGPFALAVYQLLGLAILLVMIFPVYRLVVWPLYRLSRFLIQRRKIAIEHRDIYSWVRPIGGLVVVWMLTEGVIILNLPLQSAGWLLAFLIPACWLLGALTVYQLIDPLMKIIAGRAANQTGATTFASMGFPVMSLVIKIAVMAWGLSAVLRLFDFDVGTILTGLGIGGLAFALAAQDTLKNFFGSLMIIADRTFRVGDLVQISGNQGVVESLGLRTTRIRGLDDALLTIPNSDLTTAHVTNFGARRYRRMKTQFTVPYGTTSDRLVQFRDGILGLIRGHAHIRPDKYEVAVNDLGASGIEILLQVFFDVRDSHAELVARDDLLLQILKLAEQLNIAFTSPTVILERNPIANVTGPARDSHLTS